MVFDEGTQVVLLVAGDKAGNWTKWYRQAIPLAEAHYKAFKEGQW